MRPTLLQSRRGRRFLLGFALTTLVVAVFAPRVGGPLFGLALLALLLVGIARLERAVTDTRRELHALAQVRPLVGDLPVPLGGWAAEPVLLEQAVRLSVELRPRLIVECGSGSSTVVLARCLRALGGGRIVSIDHDPAYAQATTQLLALHGVEAVATVVAAPLVERRTKDNRMLRWYAPDYEPLLTEPIDLLLVDGPPRSTGPRARYPAIEFLRPLLSARSVILLDDGDRPDEREIAHSWARELPGRLTYLPGARGGWLLRRSG